VSRHHHTLFTPRDFDLSPYFKIIKPKLVEGFDPHDLSWSEEESRQADGHRLAGEITKAR
jgi:hypothetical protein